MRTQARKAGDAWLLEGEKAAVLGAPMAHRLVVSARTAEGIGLFLAQNPARKGYRRIDGMRAADVELRAQKAERLDGGLERIEEVIDFATALVCAEAVGAMKSACDSTLEYLKTRKQFGVPIGTFQALQHRMVDMFIAHEQARSMACLACSKVDQSEERRETGRARCPRRRSRSPTARATSARSRCSCTAAWA